MRVNKKLHSHQEVKRVTQSKDGGNGHQEYNPEVEFEYVDADVWYEKNPETGERIDVTYTDDILDRINDEDEEEDNPPSSETE